MKEPMRVLQVIGAMDRGGAETLIMNLYRNIDRNQIQFDFLVNETRKCDYDEEIRELGGHIHSIPRYNIFNYMQYKSACKEFFQSHYYPVVHGHIGLPAAIYLDIARNAGSFTIAHSHNQHHPINARELAYRTSTYPTRYVADFFLACSQQAGIDRYGNNVANGDNFHVLNNGIDINRFRFSPTRRSETRLAMSIDDKTPVFGNVGRLTQIKNHRFLLKVFKNINAALPNAILLLAGRGEEENNLKLLSKELGISNNVRFIGVTDDVPALLDAIDVFIFPSIREGLPYATVEAQASGARCLLADCIPMAAKICNDTKFESLSSGVDTWTELALELYQNPAVDRSLLADKATQAGFSIMESAEWLTNLYLSVENNRA